MVEAYLTNTPYREGNKLHFSATPILPNVDMASICHRCNLEDWCDGSIIHPPIKKAHIKFDDPRIREITSSDTSNCGIAIDLSAIKKEEIQLDLFPRRGFSSTI